MVLVPGCTPQAAWRASNEGFGAQILASGGLEGIKEWFWCPDARLRRPGGHQRVVLVPRSGPRAAWRASKNGFGARMHASGGLEGIKEWFWCPDQGLGRLGGHQRMVLVPGCTPQAAWRASKSGFGAQIRASGGLEGIKEWFWCPDARLRRPGGHQRVVLVPRSGPRAAWRASKNGFGARMHASGGLEGIKEWFWCPDQGLGRLGGHQRMVLVPGCTPQAAWRASKSGFGAQIRALVGLEGIKRGFWCPDPGLGRPGGHQSTALIPRSEP